MRTINDWFAGERGGLVKALVVSNLFAVLLFMIRIAVTDNLRYWFLIWNLVLAAVPLFFAWRLRLQLRKNVWSAPASLVLTFLWLSFLPNSFYLLSDLIHLHDTGEINLLYDAVMFSMLIFNAFVLGYLSVYIVHRELTKRIEAKIAHRLIGAVFLLCGVAIYFGRYLRWYTWDLVVNPFGLLFDISERIINPADHPRFFATTVVFAALLSVIYYVIWSFIKTIKGGKTWTDGG